MMKQEATCSSKTSVDFKRTTQHCVPQYRILHKYRCQLGSDLTSAPKPLGRFEFLNEGFHWKLGDNFNFQIYEYSSGHAVA
jgi:hypothetical protein